jgi:hypothetical protein
LERSRCRIFDASPILVKRNHPSLAFRRKPAARLTRKIDPTSYVVLPASARARGIIEP